MRTLVKHKPPRIYLLSFPKSGNTWMRYCIELLTERPTASFSLKPDAQELPISYTFGHKIDLSKKPIWKAHRESEFNFAGYKYSPRRDLLIIAVRNPKEAIARWMTTSNGADLLSFTGLMHFQSYFNVLRLFDSWAPDKRILIYYEDLISDPRETLEKLVNFLNDPKNKFDAFFDEYEKHKERGLKFYEYNGGSQSQGNDLLYHSRKMSAVDRKNIDQFIKEKYKYLWEKYLENRYSEETLEENNFYRAQILHNVYRSFILD